MRIFNLACPYNNNKECKHCRRITAQNGWRFRGCFYPPFKGKFIGEIKECPKTQKGGRGMTDKEKTIKELKEAFNSLDITNIYQLK